MHSDLFIRPVESGFPRDEDGVLHLLESIFHMVLHPRGKDDFLGAPIKIVATLDAFAQSGAFKFFKGS